MIYSAVWGDHSTDYYTVTIYSRFSRIFKEAAGNVVTDLHFDSATQPTMTSISVEHGQV